MKKIKNHPERISNLMPFIDQYNWKGIEFPSHSKDWKKLEQNNNSIALNILYVPYKTKQTRLAYISKYNHQRNNQVILLMITDDAENWHYLEVKSISRLLRGITSNHNGDFCCLNCFHSCRTKGTHKNHEKVCNNYDYCYVKMAKEDKKALKYNPGEKSLKVPFIIYADLECFLGKIETYQNDPKKSSTEKKAEHTPSVYSWITCCSFDTSKNEWGYYRGKSCMEMFCKDLRNQETKIVNYEKKEMMPLTNEEKES